MVRSLNKHVCEVHSCRIIQWTRFTANTSCVRVKRGQCSVCRLGRIHRPCFLLSSLHYIQNITTLLRVLGNTSATGINLKFLKVQSTRRADASLSFFVLIFISFLFWHDGRTRRRQNTLPIVLLFGVNLKIWQSCLKVIWYCLWENVLWTTLSFVDWSHSIMFGLELRLCK